MANMRDCFRSARALLSGWPKLFYHF